MPMRDLIPWGRSNTQAPAVYRNLEHSPFMTLHREVNRLFDEVFREFDDGFPLRPGSSNGRMAWPSIEISETDTEIRVSAEVPGLEEKDIEVLLEDDVLTLRGERRSEHDNKDRHFSERYYGRFERRIPLGWDVEAEKVGASFRNGVLTVTLPKRADAEAKVKRITINH